MHWSGGIITTGCAVLTVLVLLLPQAVRAQGQNDGGVVYTLRFDEQLRNEDSDTFARSLLGFDISSVTRRDRLDLSLGAAIDLGRQDLDTIEIDEPSASLLFERNSRDALLRFSLDYARDDIRNSVLTDDPDGVGLVIEEGQREDARGSARFEWGREAPFGGAASIDYSALRYLDTTATSLIDQDTLNASVNLTFEIDQTTTAFTRLTYRDIDRDGATGSERLAFNIGVDVDVTPTLAADVELGYSKVSESGPNADPDTEGFTASASLVQTLPNGTLSGSISTDLSETGRRSIVQVARFLELRDGSFRASLGLGEQSGAERALFGLSYSRENPRNTISFNFDQAFSASTGGSAVLNSNLGVNYRQELSSRTGYSLGMTWRETAFLTTTDPTVQQLSVSLNFDHALTDDWSLVGGLSHTKRRTEGGTTTSDDELFLGLRSVLSWRP